MYEDTDKQISWNQRWTVWQVPLVTHGCCTTPHLHAPHLPEPLQMGTRSKASNALCCVVFSCEEGDIMRPDINEELFNKMDRDGSGYIDAKDYRRVLRGYATNQDIRARILNMDDDLDGQVSFEEFSKAMNTAIVEEPSDLPSPPFAMKMVI